MRTPGVSIDDLRVQLDDFRARYPKLLDDQLFVLWFLRAFITESEEQAAPALTGASRDKGIDAVLVDEPAKTAFVVQGKFRKKLAGKSEARVDVTSFASLAPGLWGSKEGFGVLCKDLDPLVAQKLSAARDRLKKREYRLQLHYVTLGRCSDNLRDEARAIVRQADGPSEIHILDGRQALLLLCDYLDGVAPPVPSLDLPIESGGRVESSGVIQRRDPQTGIESWVFSMRCSDVGELFDKAGVRLFARNIRGFLGSTGINRGMEETLRKEPEHFWYYNNGVTIICDGARRIGGGGKDVLHVVNPQVINGQQTTRILHSQNSKDLRASVLVRVITVPRDADGNSNSFEGLVSRIVAATNSQNAIGASDLMSNDRRQIEIEREFRKVGYHYLRKRQTKGEAKRAAGAQFRYLVKKEELAQAVAACEFDPRLLREGKERLFEERYYGSIFDRSSPQHYLSRYWLMRKVGYAASGYPERAYAKWLVVHFVWSRLGRVIRGATTADRFRSECERNGEAIWPLIRAIDAVFIAALRFYRRRRGKGKHAIDVSSFFRRAGLHHQFDRFWRGSTNTSRPTFQKGWIRFEKSLKEGLMV